MAFGEACRLLPLALQQKRRERDAAEREHNAKWNRNCIFCGRPASDRIEHFFHSARRPADDEGSAAEDGAATDASLKSPEQRRRPLEQRRKRQQKKTRAEMRKAVASFGAELG